jgi:N-acyl-D-aspartate/D-glutamate deacylase
MKKSVKAYGATYYVMGKYGESVVYFTNKQARDEFVNKVDFAEPMRVKSVSSEIPVFETYNDYVEFKNNYGA